MNENGKDRSSGHNFDSSVEFVPGRGVPPQQPPIATYLVEDVARILHVCEQTVRRYIRHGELEAWQVGQLYRIPKYALEDFLGDCRLKACGHKANARGVRLEPLLKPSEVQQILRIGRDGFRMLVHTQGLPVVWLGDSDMRIQPSALRDWLNSRDRQHIAEKA
jgi:DNA binding domain, excisionase family